MKLSDFYINQTIIYSPSWCPGKHWIGTVISIQSKGITVAYGEDYTKYWGWSKFNYRPNAMESTCQYMQPSESYQILTIQDRINNRCKKLWNNSNYVKQNPQRAY